MQRGLEARLPVAITDPPNGRTVLVDFVRHGLGALVLSTGQQDPRALRHALRRVTIS
jgi:hypothetical protein